MLGDSTNNMPGPWLAEYLSIPFVNMLPVAPVQPLVEVYLEMAPQLATAPSMLAPNECKVGACGATLSSQPTSQV